MNARLVNSGFKATRLLIADKPTVDFLRMDFIWNDILFKNPLRDGPREPFHPTHFMRFNAYHMRCESACIQPELVDSYISELSNCLSQGR